MCGDGLYIRKVMQHAETPDAIGCSYQVLGIMRVEDGALQAPPLEMQQIFTPFFFVGEE